LPPQVVTRAEVRPGLCALRASGEGNPDMPRKRGAVWANQRCHRSSLAGTAQAALALERGDPTTSVTFVHLACSGATIADGLIGPYEGIDARRNAKKLPRQVNKLTKVAAVRPVDAVLLSIGANDVNFGPMSMFCIVVRNCMDRRFNPEHPLRRPLFNRHSKPLAEVEARALNALPDLYAKLDGYLKRKLPPARHPPVYVVEYFDPTTGPHGWCRILGISPLEAEWAHEHVLAPLNHVIAEAARRYSWTLVPGVAEAFRGHGYCAKGGRRWIRTFGESLRLHGRSKLKAAAAGTLHPNERGHLATAVLIAGVLGRGLPADEAGPSPSSSGDADFQGWAALAGAGLLGTGIAAWLRRRRSVRRRIPP
jgi:hypothetical protein